MANTSVDPNATTPAVFKRHENARPTHIGRVYFLGVLMLLFVAFLSYCIIHWGMSDFQSIDQKRVLERQKILADRVVEDAKLLNDEPSWIKRDKGLVRVPLAEAMDLALKDLTAKKPQPTDVPLSAAKPANSSLPPSGGTPSAPTASTPQASASTAASVGSGSAGPGSTPGSPSLSAAKPPLPAPAPLQVTPSTPATSSESPTPSPTATPQ